MIKLCKSGGQSGVDLAGLKAGVHMGIEVKAYMPYGFRTLDGPKPEYQKLYNAEQDESSAYSPRTEKNVLNSDGTIRIAYDFNSSGEKCTLRFIKKHKKPFFDVLVKRPSVFSTSKKETPEQAAKWIIDNKIAILNIAGNSEKTCYGIGNWAYRYLICVFDIVNNQKIDLV